MRTLITLMLLSSSLHAAEPVEADAVAKILRGFLLKKLPNPAVDTKHDWGKQAEVITGVDVKRRGLLNWVATPQTEKKNDGNWMHLVVVVNDPANKLTLELKDVKSPEPGRLTFQAAVRAASVDLKVEQQVWKLGVRVFSNETRANCKAAVHLDCEVNQRLETKPGNTFPEMVLAFKVNKAELFYDNLVIEHTLGVGGEAAKAIGEATHKLLTQIKPSVERDMVAKVNAEIVKAASDKEVRVGISGLMKK